MTEKADAVKKKSRGENSLPLYLFHQGTNYNAYRFMGVLQKNGISATLRRQIGADIGGACGQLRAAYVKEKNEREIAAKDVRD